MKTRDKVLLDLRPKIPSAKIFNNTCPEETFQNKVLRPIVTLQNQLLLLIFKNYIRKFKNVFYDLSTEEKLDYIDDSIQKDFKFRNYLKGVVISHFTMDEFEYYSSNSSSVNRRMMELVKEELKNHLQLLEYKNVG